MVSCLVAGLVDGSSYTLQNSRSSDFTSTSADRRSVSEQVSPMLSAVVGALLLHYCCAGSSPDCHDNSDYASTREVDPW